MKSNLDDKHTKNVHTSSVVDVNSELNKLTINVSFVVFKGSVVCIEILSNNVSFGTSKIGVSVLYLQCKMVVYILRIFLFVYKCVFYK